MPVIYLVANEVLYNPYDVGQPGNAQRLPLEDLLYGSESRFGDVDDPTPLVDPVTGLPKQIDVSDFFVLGFTSTAIPAGAVVTSVSLTILVHNIGTGGSQIFVAGFATPQASLRAPGFLYQQVNGFANLPDPELSFRTTAAYEALQSAPIARSPSNSSGYYSGGVWTQADIDKLAIAYGRGPHVNSPAPPCAMYVKLPGITVVYALAPSVAVSGPTGTVTDESNPAVTWDFTPGLDGSGQERYRIKVFSAAQYGAFGFDPWLAAAVWDSGVVSSNANSVRPPILPNGTFRAYVFGAALTNGVVQWAPATPAGPYSQFTLNVPGPGAPTVAAAADSPQGRIIIDVTQGSSPPDWEGVEVQRSTDGGATWTDLRPATVTAPPPAPPTVIVPVEVNLYSPDNPAAWADAFGAASAFDQEFQRTTSPATPPPNWLFQNQSAATYIEIMGQGVVSVPVGSNSNADVVALVQPVPSQAAYVAAGKAQTHYAAAEYVGFGTGLILTDGTKGVGIYWDFTGDINTQTWANINAGAVVVVDTLTPMESPSYWRIVKHSATDYDFAFSYDGLLWETLTTGYDVSAFLIPTHIGFLFNQGNGVQRFTCDWFRVRP